MEAKRLFAGMWALCGIAVAALFTWAGIVGGFGAGPLIGIAGGLGVAVWQGRRALGVQNHFEEDDGEWY